ncbi:MAG: hypothetical protein K2G26_02090, partial [Clostridia bacterium]|nr:hypothetical protein [Clostridia bacterium]
KLGGTARNPEHTVSVTVRGKSFSGSGANFAEAKKQAAQAAYEFLNKGC